MILLGGNRLHVAVLVDFAKGQKKRVDELRRSKLLRDGHVLSAEMYAGQDEADTEDLLRRATYTALVNQTYGLKDGLQFDPTRSTARTARVLKEVEEHFATLPVGAPDFDHFRPAAYLLENRSDVLSKLPELEAALGKFERLFADLNALLAGEPRPAMKAVSGSR